MAHAVATDYGFETAAGVPIRYDGVRFGVLGVHQRRPDVR
ncbi:GAF domain-containing protein [Natrialba swarupiae]|nr:GAF domain-containing protein [Natrialba swarupiae]